MALPAYTARVTVRAGIWGYWKLDETSGTSLADSSGNGRVLTLAGAPTRSAVGPTLPNTGSRSYGFTGTDQYAQGATPAGGSAQTFECWVYLAALPTAQAAIMGTAASATPGSVNSENSLWVNTDGTVTLYQYNGGYVNLVSPAALALQRWHHVVGSWSPSGMKLRINKTTVASNTAGSQPYGQRPFFLHGGLNNGGGAVSLALPSYYLTQLSDTETDAGYDALVVPQGFRSASMPIMENVGVARVAPMSSSQAIYEYVVIEPSQVVESDQTQIQGGIDNDQRGLIVNSAPAQVVPIGTAVENDSTFSFSRTVLLGQVSETDIPSRIDVDFGGGMPWAPASWSGTGQPFGTTGSSSTKWMPADAEPVFRAIAQATELDVTSALVLSQSTPAQSQTLLVASEADSTAPLTVVTGAPPQVVAIKTAVETDTAGLLTAGNNGFVQINQILELDSAAPLAIKSGIYLPVGQVTEVDSAGRPSLVHSTRQVSEVDSPPLPVVPVAGARVLSLTQLVETDTAVALIPVTGSQVYPGSDTYPGPGLYPAPNVAQAAAIGQASEVESAGSLSGITAFSKQLTQVLESDVAGSLPSRQTITVALGSAGELDAALPLGPSVRLGVAVGSDQAQSLTIKSGPVSASIGRTSEVDATLGALGAVFLLAMQAEEGDTAYPLTVVLAPVVVDVGQPEETDVLIGGSLSAKLTLTQGIGQTSETSSTNILGTVLPVGLPQESDTAGLLTVRAVIRTPVSILQESDSALRMGLVATFTSPISSPAELDSVIGRLGLALALVSAVEMDTLRPMELVETIIVRRILIDGQLRRLRLLGVSDGQGGVRLARESYWDGTRRLEFTKERITS